MLGDNPSGETLGERDTACSPGLRRGPREWLLPDRARLPASPVPHLPQCLMIAQQRSKFQSRSLSEVWQLRHISEAIIP